MRLFVGLTNKNAFEFNLWDQVYSPDKQDEIATKLKELNEKSKISKFETYEKEMSKIQEIRYQMIGKGFHSGAITSFEVCSQRPILMTCCKEDQTVRIWNYVTN